MSLPILCLLYTLAGLLLDFLITLHFRYVANGKKIKAAVTTFFYVVASFLVMGQILTNQGILLNTIFYAIGSAGGTLLAFGRSSSGERQQER